MVCATKVEKVCFFGLPQAGEEADVGGILYCLRLVYRALGSRDELRWWFGPEHQHEGGAFLARKLVKAAKMYESVVNRWQEKGSLGRLPARLDCAHGCMN